MAAPMGPPGRRLRCDECGRRGHTARSHEPGGILYVAEGPQAGPDLLAELAEVELCEAVSDAGRSCILPTGHAPVELGPGSTLNAFADHRSDAGPFWEPGNGPAVRTAQQLADAETAARRLDQVRRFITPAGEIKTLQGADVTPERVQRMCTDGAWSRNPDDGTWSCAECGKPAAAPVLEQIEALQDDAPGQLVEVDLPPLQPRARWTIEGASADPAKPEEQQVGTSRELPQSMLMGTLPDIPEPAGVLVDVEPVEPGPAFPGADCDCLGDGDLHPPGSGGCVATEADGVGAVPEQLDTRRPVETVGGPTSVELLGPDTRDQPEKPRGVWLGPIRDSFTSGMGGDGPVHHGYDTGAQYGPEAFGPPWATSAGPLARPRITLPGVYHLTDDEYHDPAVTGAWVSNSDLKAMTVDGCPAQWRYDRDNGVTDDREVYLFGKAVHAEVLGKGSSVVVRPAEWSDWRKAAARAWKAEQLAAGLVPVTPEEAETARAMAAAVHADPVAAEALSRPGRPEVAMFWREQLPSGRWVQRRGMVDYLTDDGDPIDFKTAESANPNERMERAIYEYGYHRQAVTYEAAIVALGLSPTYPKMLFLFQQKRAPYLVTPVELDDRAAVVGEGETRAALEVYAECVESGVWPGYGKAIMTIPEYRGREFDEEMT